MFKVGLVLLSLSLVGLACDDDETVTADASVDASITMVADAAPAADTAGDTRGVPLACQAFCRARQINIQNCAAQDGDRKLVETYEQCASSYERHPEFVELCPTGPSCGGWLAGCISDPESAKSDRFPAGTTCADSVAAGRFRP